MGEKISKETRKRITELWDLFKKNKLQTYTCGIGLVQTVGFEGVCVCVCVCVCVYMRMGL